MKKLLLGLGALAMVFSGVAAVSAYEAHTINVKAKVENAMDVNLRWAHFGTVFPEEFFLVDFNVGTSGSFCSPSQERLTDIDYEIWAEWKEILDAGQPTGTYYPWLGDAVWLAQRPVPDLEMDGETDLADDTFPRTIWTCVGDPPGTQPGAKYVLGPYRLHKPGVGVHDLHMWVMALDVPVFQGYYNYYTDPKPKPSGMDVPTVILTGDRNVPGGLELGVDLKIQVTGFDDTPH